VLARAMADKNRRKVVTGITNFALFQVEYQNVPIDRFCFYLLSGWKWKNEVGYSRRER
jgi:hypothetical protein